MDEKQVAPPTETPGIGTITPDLKVMEEYLVDVEIKVNGGVLYATPPVSLKGLSESAYP